MYADLVIFCLSHMNESPLLLSFQQAATVFHCTECMALSDTHWLWGWALCRLRSKGLHIILRSNPLASYEQPRYSLYIYFGLLCSRPTHPISGEYTHARAHARTHIEAAAAAAARSIM